MLAIKRSARVSITTGTAILKEVAGGDPNNEGLILMGVASGDDKDSVDNPWCLPLHSLRSFRGQVPRVTQRPPFGCFAALIPCCLHVTACEKDDSRFFLDASI